MAGLLLTGDTVYLAPVEESEKHCSGKELQSLRSRVHCVVERRGH